MILPQSMRIGVSLRLEHTTGNRCDELGTALTPEFVVLPSTFDFHDTPIVAVTRERHANRD